MHPYILLIFQETFDLLKPSVVERDEMMFSFLYPAFRDYLAVSHHTTLPQSVQLEIIKKMSHVDPVFYRLYLHTNENVNYDIISEVVNKMSHSCKHIHLNQKVKSLIKK